MKHLVLDVSTEENTNNIIHYVLAAGVTWIYVHICGIKQMISPTPDLLLSP